MPAPQLIKSANCKLWLPCQTGSSPAAGQTPDMSGNNNYGVLTSIDIQAGKFGNALYYSANTDTCVIQNESQFDFAYNSQWTINAWIKLDAVNQANRMIVSKGDAANPTWYLAVQDNGTTTVNRLAFVCDDYPGSDKLTAITSNSVLTDNVWYMVSVVKSGSTYKAANVQFYVDSIAVSQSGSIDAPSGTSGITNNYSLEVGNMPTRAFGFLGFISHVGVWNTDLSSKEIAVLYNSTRGAYLL